MKSYAFPCVLGSIIIFPCFSHGSHAFPMVPLTLTGSDRGPQIRRQVQQIQCTSGAFAALRGDGRVYTWGDGARGGDCRRLARERLGMG